MAVKVSDLAKELGVSTEEILEQLQKLYVDAEDGKSKIDDKIAGLLRHKLGGAAPVKEPAKEKKAVAKAATKPAKKTKAKEMSSL